MPTEPATPGARTKPDRPPRSSLRTAPASIQAALYVSVMRPRLNAFARAQLWKYRVPPSRLETDDVIQYTIVELLERWATVDEPSKYMFTVAGNYIRRAAREGGRFTGAPVQPSRDIDEAQADDLDRMDISRAVWSSASPTPLTEHAAAAAEVRAGLGTALARLTPAQSQAVRLVDGLDLSRAEAAAAMGVAEGTVSPHRARGLAKLRHLAGHLRGALYVVAGLGVASGLGWLLWRGLHEGANIVARSESVDLLALVITTVTATMPLLLRIAVTLVSVWSRDARRRAVAARRFRLFLVQEPEDIEQSTAGRRRNRRRPVK
ncbi:sigma-70 family RNA polymerase sigma factor [Micromonospora carbonacea]|uniref:sigma-70 family RNA polymerase sigma factor n=1 Tax=Micromonospora carbonacea TaxID=47853 RepID=UPI0037248795